MLIHSPKELASFIIEQRKKLKLSQAKVGDLIGLKQKTISAFENKPESTKLETLFQLLSAVNLDIRITSKDETAPESTQWTQEW